MVSPRFNNTNPLSSLITVASYPIRNEQYRENLLQAFNNVLDRALVQEENQIGRLRFSSITKEGYSVIFFDLRVSDNIGEYLEVSIKVNQEHEPELVNLDFQPQRGSSIQGTFAWNELTESLTNLFDVDRIAAILQSREAQILKLHGHGFTGQDQLKEAA